MNNNLKRPFIMFLIFSCLVVGWQTISGNAIFSGVAIPFVGLIVILALLTYTIVINKEVRQRIMDLYVLACAFAVLELIVYLVLEFGLGNYKTWHGFNIFQNVICVLGLIYFLYVVFRAIYEAKGWNCGVLEVLLGNKKPVKKVKQPKEFANGSLEAKPNRKYQDEVEDITKDVKEDIAKENEVEQQEQQAEQTQVVEEKTFTLTENEVDIKTGEGEE